jgi:hypothetical protein
LDPEVQSMIRKTGNRFSERIMLKPKENFRFSSTIRKSGSRFSGEIALRTIARPEEEP